jgi:hypothetical protein
MRIAVHVSPRSACDEITGWRGGELSVRVRAVPEEGRANSAVCAVIAKALGVPKSAVDVIVGGTGRHKQIEVAGVTDADIVRVFGRPPAGSC